MRDGNAATITITSITTVFLRPARSPAPHETMMRHRGAEVQVAL
eukprot:CAMPEP_0115877322 /NCGR_PEP_ID=MMETSP0287-20121206/26159_1 /TAXON_ID=412157 /ORGANISM="Chrysochromulina rotalis, Strain UIO044" /LENGTH=43 /DNA_ID= /DNA_START= /DNA_END= /DNA_ORIENTATION=